MRCPHEFFKPVSAECARCGEPGRFPSSAMSRHARVGEAGSRIEGYIEAVVDLTIPGQMRHATLCPYAEVDRHAGGCAIDSRMVGDVLVRATGITVGAVRTGRVGGE